MLRQLCLGMRIYANDNGGVLPPAARWCDALLPIMKRVEMFQCPQYDAKYGYAMNARLSGKRLEDLADPASTVILFDSTTGKRNAHDEGESWPVPPRHKDGMNCVAFADGRAECLRTKPDFRVRMKGGEPQVGAERSSAAERPTGASVAGGRRSE